MARRGQRLPMRPNPPLLPPHPALPPVRAGSRLSGHTRTQGGNVCPEPIELILKKVGITSSFVTFVEDGMGQILVSESDAATTVAHRWHLRHGGGALRRQSRLAGPTRGNQAGCGERRVRLCGVLSLIHI